MWPYILIWWGFGYALVMVNNFQAKDGIFSKSGFTIKNVLIGLGYGFFVNFYILFLVFFRK